MTYEEFTKDPVLVAVFSSLLALLLAHIYGVWKGKQSRSNSLQILRGQLENHERQLRELRVNLDNDAICWGLDSSPILNFINGNVVDFVKDKNLISALYAHLDNIHLIERGLNRIELRSAGFTDVQHQMKVELAQNMRNAIDEHIRQVNDCLDLL